ncbi:MAG: hypothetical protein RPU35_14600 [Candidatus Sedimenticola sp. (ex Thyasira tokunagai)]
MKGENDRDEDLRQAILDAWDIAEARSNAPYDGVLGSLPDWVPEPIQKNFTAVRDRVIGNWGYEPSEAVKWLDRFVTIGTDNNEWFYPAIYPCGRELDPDYFTETIGYLAHLRWVKSLGPEKGLAELAGDVAVTGYIRREQLTEFGNTRGKELHEQRAAEWQKWNKCAKKLVNKYRHLQGRGKKTEVARLVIKELCLVDSVNTVRSRIIIS